VVGLTVAVALVARQASKSFRRVRLAGDSMLPAFQPGDRLLVGPPARIAPGTVVALPDPRSPARLIVKRVHAAGRTWVDVRGDNPAASTDSRHFGPVPRSQLTGRIVYRYGPAGRTGWLPGQIR
jgi:nickel-type superoxide dismutase maturation protease